MRELALTPSNLNRLSDRLSQMRGAAMKLGQMFSMQSEDLLPPELARALATLRADACAMPRSQLRRVLAWEHTTVAACRNKEARAQKSGVLRWGLMRPDPKECEAKSRIGGFG